jgi:hypothetical protein
MVTVEGLLIGILLDHQVGSILFRGTNIFEDRAARLVGFDLRDKVLHKSQEFSFLTRPRKLGRSSCDRVTGFVAHLGNS